MDRSYSAKPLPLADKLNDDPGTNKAGQSTVKCVYQASIGGQWRTVTILWGKNLMNQTFTITFDNLEGELLCTCKVDLKPWHFWSRKGTKYCDVDGDKVEVHWDLRSAKFYGSPEPSSDYYVALVSEEELVLLLGDNKRKAYKKTKAKPAGADAVMFYKKENVFAKKSFSTRAKFDERRKENEIVVESSTLGPKDPEMWISIDGIVLIHIRNLQWKFRGNQTMLVHKQPVQVFWDVHDWLFTTPGAGHGLFIFKPGATEAESDKDAGSCVSGSSGGGSSVGGGESGSVGGGGGGGENSSVGGDADSENSMESRYYSAVSYTTAPEFCLFLHAYKME